MNRILRSKGMKNSVTIPPSKSYSHRGIIAAGLSNNDVVLENLGDSIDTRATLKAFEAMGKTIKQSGNLTYFSGLINTKKAITIDCYESGSTLRFMIPIVAALGITCTFKGHGELPKRPIDELLDVLQEHGISVVKKSSLNLPLTISGQLKAGKFEIPGNISSQYVSGLLLALSLLENDSSIELTRPLESKGYVDLTIDTMKKFSVDVVYSESTYRIKGSQSYACDNYYIEADYSNAAFFIVSALLDKGAQTIKGLTRDSLQGDRMILAIIEALGGAYQFEEDCLRVEHKQLSGGTIDVTEIPDLLPILSVMACFSSGKTLITGGSRVRLKESDRILAMVTELRKMGVEIEELDDGMLVTPIEHLKGMALSGWNDHRIVMALTVASFFAKGETVISDAEAVNKSFPTFFDYIEQ